MSDTWLPNPSRGPATREPQYVSHKQDEARVRLSQDRTDPLMPSPTIPSSDAFRSTTSYAPHIQQSSFDDGLDDFDRSVLGDTTLPSRHEHDKVQYHRALGSLTHDLVPHTANYRDGYVSHAATHSTLRDSATHQHPRYSHDTFTLSPEPSDARSEGSSGAKRRQVSTQRDSHDIYRFPRHSEHDPRHNSSPTISIITRKQKAKPINAQTTFSSSTPPNNGYTEVSKTPVVQGIPLVNLREALPERLRSVFPFELFNAVQSRCFEKAYNTTDNVVVSAPTGSGKTVVLELAICKLALDRGNENFKIVYQAPTKALCSERARDWEKKFSHMSLKCAELTGDTSQAEMRRVGEASIIVTTPEKWDSITRKWHDHQRLLQMVELFLIDEVHILKDVRGATLEAVVSRMKTIGANVRFVALSATVPNSEDIATWLGRSHINPHVPAHREIFDESFRPVKLEKFVYGFNASGNNDFAFDSFLDSKLPGLISKHSSRKPILVFCFTRKSCETTAGLLANYMSGHSREGALWPLPQVAIPVINQQLKETVQYGVAFHHAGLDLQDRVAIETAFLKGQMGVICCTSTLAVGVNLPCHTVVLKGTVCFADDKMQEFSDLEVMQMLGRAGRPQFDDSATAIILTRSHHAKRYEKMVSGQEILESTLHLHLIEHLNSEVCLGTIRDLASAKTWLRGTFLSVRLRRNPGHYKMTGGISNPLQIDESLSEICERDIKFLQDAEMLTPGHSFTCTDYGRAMSRYMIEFTTMKLLLSIPRAVSMEALITILSQATEFRDFRLKPAERTLFREVNQSPLVLYPIKDAISSTGHKVSLIVQAHLGSVPFTESGEAGKLRRQLMMEKKAIFERLQRLVRAVVDCKGHDHDAVGTRTALELARAISAESWEGRATQLTQVPNIGPVAMRKLAAGGVRTVLELAERDQHQIEHLVGRNAPFGKKLLEELQRFPRLSLDLKTAGHRIQPRNSEAPAILNVAATIRCLNKALPLWGSGNKPPLITFVAETRDGTLTYFWRGSVRRLDMQAGLELTFPAALRFANDVVTCRVSCEDIVGTEVVMSLKHNLPDSVFPSATAPACVLDQLRKPAPAAKQPPIPLPAPREPNQGYLDDFDIDEVDLIEAAEMAMSSLGSIRDRETSTTAEDSLPRPHELPRTVSASQIQQEAQAFDETLAADGSYDQPQPDDAPVQLPNGKWRCNHACGGGGLTKTGKPCTHLCCKEGLDKPRKRPLPKPKKRKAYEVDDSIEINPQPKPSFQQPKITETFSKRTKTGHERSSPSQFASSASCVSKLEPAAEVMRPRVPLLSQNNFDVGADLGDIECIDLSGLDDEPVLSAPRTGSATNFARLKAPSQTFQDASLEELFNRGTGYSIRPGDGPFREGGKDQILFQISKQEAAKVNYHSPAKSGADRMPRGGSAREDTPVFTSSAAGFCDDLEMGDLFEEFELSKSKNVASTMADIPGKAKTAAAEETLPTERSMERHAKAQEEEPEWVSESDPELVKLFRGVVKFV